jgi:hypothetical protein
MKTTDLEIEASTLGALRLALCISGQLKAGSFTQFSTWAGIGYPYLFVNWSGMDDIKVTMISKSLNSSISCVIISESKSGEYLKSGLSLVKVHEAALLWEESK